MSNYSGKVRFILHKTDKNNSFEENYEFRQYVFNGLITDVSEFQEADMIEYELQSTGLDGLEDQIKEILEKYEVGSVIELCADMHIEWSQCSWEYPNEWDSISWLDNILERKLNEEQIKRFFPIDN